RPFSGEHPHVCCPTPAASGLLVTGVDQHPVEPRLEPVGIAESWKLSPGRDEGRLHGILGSVSVAQDPIRDRQAPVADAADKGADSGYVRLAPRWRHRTYRPD